MAIAYDASSQGTQDGASPFSWTHTPVGTPKGIWVGVVMQDTVTDTISAVTYGGVSMTKINSVFVDGAEDGVAVAFYLGSSIPVGAQTVTVTHGSLVGEIKGFAISVTAASDKNTQLAGTGSATSTTSLNPSVTITGIAGASYGFGVLYSGQDSTGSVTAGSGMTMRQQVDMGANTGSVESSTSENASGDLTIGFTQITDEAALVGIAVEEVGSATMSKLTLLGVS